MNDCCSAYKYLVFSFCIESEQFNVGQQYHLCLRIEWQLSKRRKAFGVLGSPEKISMDNGQARIKIALANVQCNKQPKPPKIVR